MDKRVIFAVAGSGKTTYIVSNLSDSKRSLIVTYTDANFANLQHKILNRFMGKWPHNIVLMTYFQFLFRFCYKPFLAYSIRARGLCFDKPPRYKNINQRNLIYYLTKDVRLYSNRLSLFIENYVGLENIKNRIERYFDEFIIDEVQDIAGRDFNFLKGIMSTNVNLLFVGDYYQHTYDTSFDGNVNSGLFDSKAKYERYFKTAGMYVDTTTLAKSWRCAPEVCDFIRETLKIDIYPHKNNKSAEIKLITDMKKIKEIIEDKTIIKLHYASSSKHGVNNRNWGETKGEDKFNDVAVLLNNTTYSLFVKGTMTKLATRTKNKLYVALTRAHGNVYLIEEAKAYKDRGTKNA